MTGPRPAAGALTVILAVLASACSGSGTTGPGSSGGTSASAVGATFVNPVINADFADPFITLFDATYYAYATGSAGTRLQVSQSADLVTWTTPGDALVGLPPWMIGDTWAPEVVSTPAGYVMYYSGRHGGGVERPNGEGALCLSSAVADTPAGPFTDQGAEPLACQPDLGGSIDPTVFADGETRYLIWKNDGNCCGIPTRLWMQELSEDGLQLIGDEPIDLGVLNDQRWEGGVIEAPTLLHHADTYYLFFSANKYDSARYAVGYATAAELTGPYVDAENNPLLAFAAPAIGTGHQSILADDDGQLWMAYHAWDVNAVGYNVGGRRALWIDPLRFEGGVPVVDGPNASPQPKP